MLFWSGSPIQSQLPGAPSSKLTSGVASKYVWTRIEDTIQALETNTSSGSLCVNLCLQQFAQHNLPFGGVNTSGIGNAHGFFGFKAFSHERAVMSAGPLSALKLLFPPYDARKRRLSELLIKYAT